MQQELKIQALPTNIPYVFEDLGHAKLLDFYHKSYFYINITRLQLTILQAQNNINLFRMAAAPQTTNSQIFLQLESKQKSLETKLFYLKSTRKKGA